MNNSRNKGMTLIELVIVIILLGTLAITVVPKFISLSSDARIASLKALKGVYVSTSYLINSKARLEKAHKKEQYHQLEYNGTTITTRYGYFAYNSNPFKALDDIEAVFNINFDDWDSTYEPGGATGVGATRARISPKGINDVTNPLDLGQITRCFIEHILPVKVGERPQYNINDVDC
jgi:MSHA pilin protein MshA